MTERTYLDWNATVPLRPEARVAILAALDTVGNASSVHGEGRAARRLIEAARESVARLVGARAKNVTFTSGGTEANMLALTPAIENGADKRPRERLLIGATEHTSVLSGGRFARAVVELVPVTAQGIVDLAALRERVAAAPRPLVSLMLANNETGVVHPIPEAAEIVHEAGGLLHVDAVQAAGRIPVDIEALGADLLALSAHKIGGPKGVGALVRRDESIHLTDPLIAGGGQERGLRAGTENVAGIAGFGAAAAAAARTLGEDSVRMAGLRDRLEAGLVAISPDTVIFGHSARRVPNTTLFALKGIKAETGVIAFDLAGCAVSSGAACSSGKVQISHVLTAMGVPAEQARGAIRLSLGAATTESDIECFLNAWRTLSQSLLKGRDIAA